MERGCWDEGWRVYAGASRNTFLCSLSLEVQGEEMSLGLARVAFSGVDYQN